MVRADQPREMLEHALAAEKRAIAEYDRRIRQAEVYGDVGLKVDLESQVADETRHKEELEAHPRRLGRGLISELPSRNARTTAAELGGFSKQSSPTPMNWFVT